MNININDLIESARSGGYMDFNDIAYAIFETNGNLCVIEKPSDPTVLKKPVLPLTIIVDGEWEEDNLKIAGITKPEVIKVLKNNGIMNIK